MTAWVKCDERMPEPGECLLVCHGGEVLVAVFGRFTRLWWEPGETWPLRGVTHWAELPKPPQD